MLSRIRWALFMFKYQFDMGYQFMSLLNFALLVVAASEKLKKMLDVQKTSTLLWWAIPGAFVCVWLFGVFMDKVFKYNEALCKTNQSSNKEWKELIRIARRLDKKR